MPPPRWQRIALAVTMFFITGVFGFLQPFVALYVAAAGIDKAQFGLMTAIGTATALLVQPLLGKLSDRLDARRPLMVAAAIAAGCAYLAYRAADDFLSFTLLTALGVNGFQYLNSAGGVLVGRMVATSAARGGGASYVRYRVWGSVGYVIVAMTAGSLVRSSIAGETARADLDPVFTYGPLLFFIIGALSLLVPDGRTPAAASAAHGDAATEAAAKAADGDAARNRFRFLTAYFLYQFGLYGASQFLPMFMAELGGAAWVPRMFAAGVVCEVLVMSQVGRWTDRYGRRPALALAFLLMPLRLLLYIPATSPLWVLMVQTLHGINFGVIGTIAVVFINDTATNRDRGTAQAQLAASAGLGLSLGPLVCGLIAERFGIRAMFGAMSGVGVLAAILFLAYVRESHAGAEMPRHRLLRALARPWLS